jgi:hypothetical protein
MDIFASINRCYKNFVIDRLGLFWFNLFQGYAPFFGLDLPTRQLVPNQEREYSLSYWSLATTTI